LGSSSANLKWYVGIKIAYLPNLKRNTDAATRSIHQTTGSGSLVSSENCVSNASCERLTSSHRHPMGNGPVKNLRQGPKRTQTQPTKTSLGSPKRSCKNESKDYSQQFKGSISFSFDQFARTDSLEAARLVHRCHAGLETLGGHKTNRSAQIKTDKSCQKNQQKDRLGLLRSALRPSSHHLSGIRSSERCSLLSGLCWVAFIRRGT
jgi:hypothetical protein